MACERTSIEAPPPRRDSRLGPTAYRSLGGAIDVAGGHSLHFAPTVGSTGGALGRVRAHDRGRAGGFSWIPLCSAVRVCSGCSAESGPSIDPVSREGAARLGSGGAA